MHNLDIKLISAQAEDLLVLQELVVADKMLALLFVAMLIETKQAMKKRDLTCRLHASFKFLLVFNNKYLLLRYNNCLKDRILVNTKAHILQ
jgi:hypothetical protein